MRATQGQFYTQTLQNHPRGENRFKNRPESSLVIEYSQHKGELQASGRLSQGECSGPVKRFIGGFLSHPESFWAANFQVSAASGAFGNKQQEHAWRRQEIMTAVLYSYLNSRSRGSKRINNIISGTLKQNFAGLTGRTLGVRIRNQQGALQQTKDQRRTSWYWKAGRPLVFRNRKLSLGLLRPVHSGHCQRAQDL